jgi:Protein of unknown function (DUF3681)
MASNFASWWQLPAGAFDAAQPDQATLPMSLITVGAYIATSAIVSMLRPLPYTVVMLGIYIEYAFGGALIVIFIFGVTIIGIGWLVADNPARYTALGRTMMRASHVLLVFAIALREAAATSVTPAAGTNK